MSSIFSLGEASVFREKFFDLVETAQQVVITSHFSPDDDSIGSVLLMRALLVVKYPEKNIRIIYTGSSVDRYRIFSGFENIEWVSDIAEKLEGSELLITLDGSNWRRFSKKPEVLANLSIRIGIDHHVSEPDDYTLLLKDESSRSNTELMYQIFLKDKAYDKTVAEYIFLGLVGDTGGFAYISAESSGTFLLIKELIEKIGVSMDTFRSRYMGIPLRIIPLLQELVKNTNYKTITSWPPFQYTFVSDTGSYSDEDMSAASHIYMGQYLPRVEGYAWGFVLTPRKDGTHRMSSRSLSGSVDVNDFHARLGIGGGHIRASGGALSETTVESCLEKVFEFMKNNKPVLS